ncbi:hypothetical protein KPH14_007690 [Odynerus spinipes]|uniref:Aminoacyl tRNA synthase complex-interacting multifunctional protein 2 n=1 Tax=Odynerus spinipes TaxID=1348599 RepID=A0AAD9VN73_9HYME|nr:hypothetical protein KPH14_007690 [Odynerus spinipes]
MYAMKPIIFLPEMTHHADKMYEMKNIHGEHGRNDHTRTGIKIVADVTEQNPLPEYALLEARQEKILGQLAELKKQVSTLCDFLKHTNHEKAPVAHTKKQESYVVSDHKSEPITIDLIINANPNKPPYSIIALQKVWNDTSIKLQSYVHSSVIGNVPEIYICDTHPKPNVVNLSLIWKEVEDLELVSGLYNYSLFGEINFLRYLSRILHMHSFESYADPVEATMFDTILDYCHCLQIEKSAKKQQSILQLITSKLGNKEWFGKNKPNIVDIAVWSIVKQTSIQNLPSNLKRCINTCENVFK